MIEGRPRHIDRNAHIFHLPCGFQGHVKVGFILLRLARGPDLQSPGGADASADGAEDALALLLFDEVLVYQSSGYCTHRADYKRAFGTGCNAGSAAYALLWKIDL